MSALAQATIIDNFAEASGNPDSWMISPDAQARPSGTAIKYDDLVQGM